MNNATALAITAIVIALAVYLIRTKDKRAAQKAYKREVKKKKYINEMSNLTPVMLGTHVCGLPIAEGLQCSIKYTNSLIEVKQGNNTFNLELSKVTDITATTDTEIQKQYVSSVGGAIGGAVLFGPLGAMVGGRAKEKKTTTVTHYLVITYKSEEEIKYISFEYSPSKGSIEFISKYNSSKSESNVVNL